MKARLLYCSSKELKEEFLRMDVHPEGIRLMLPKSASLPIKIDDLSPRQANILKQEMLACGGDAAVPYSALSLEDRRISIILLGTLKQYERFLEKLSHQMCRLPELIPFIRTALYAAKSIESPPFPRIMGILNITQDSFSDPGAFFDPEKAYTRALKIEEEGADIIDIGAESTRPGSEPISAKEEIERLLPLMKRLVKKLSIPISCDTYKPEVAERMLDLGVSIINDIYALQYHPKMVEIVRKAQCPVILMHMKGTPATMQKQVSYSDLISEIYAFFKERITFAESNGILSDKIILDPGIGFGKRPEDNATLLRRLPEFLSLQKTLLVGTSRKTFLGILGNGSSVTDRLEESISAAVFSFLRGASIIRAHDVRPTKKALTAIYGIIHANENTRT